PPASPLFPYTTLFRSPLIVRMRHERDACGDQFWAGRLDFDVAARVVPTPFEPHAMIRAGHVAILELGLRNGRSKIHIPQHGCFRSEEHTSELQSRFDL